jgi:hypothetical protein
MRRIRIGPLTAIEYVIFVVMLTYLLVFLFGPAPNHGIGTPRPHTYTLIFFEMLIISAVTLILEVHLAKKLYQFLRADREH